MHEKNKRLRIMAGPNGSGKSTIISKIATEYNCGPFVNADEIERILQSTQILKLDNYKITASEGDYLSFLESAGVSWLEKAAAEKSIVSLKYDAESLKVPDKPNGYDSAIAADFIRHQLLKGKETFTFETVLSHPSKIEFLKEARLKGFKSYLYFICTVDPDINIARVAQRVMEGGHDVPADKIKKRYFESLELLPSLIAETHRSFLFDNSSENKDESILPIAEIEDGKKLMILKDDVPWWVQKHVIEPLFPDK